jgi:hypothetical protein
LRFVLLILILANILFFAWAEFIGEPGRAGPPPERTLDVPRLRLYGEPSAGGAQSTANVRRCRSVGPFMAQADVDRGVLHLRSLRLTPRPRTAQFESGPTYAVSVVTPTLQAAAQTAMRLRAAGITDVNVEPPSVDSTQAVVQLGSYPERPQAEKRITQLRALGVRAAISEERYTTPVWWIDVDLASTDKMPDAGALQRVLGGGPLSQVDCPALLPRAPESAPSSQRPATSEAAPGSPRARVSYGVRGTTASANV